MARSPKWKALVEKLDSLTESNGVNAWETAKAVKELREMQSFHKAVGGKEQGEAKLQEYSGRFALGLWDMIKMIERFPNRKDWEGGRLDVLRDETAKLISSELKKGVESKESEKRGKTPKFVGREKYDRLAGRLRELEEENARLKEELVESKNENAELSRKLVEVERQLKTVKEAVVSV